jgi:hypothetical protein
MGLAAALAVGALAGFVGWPVSAWAFMLSKRPAPQTAALLGTIAALLPSLNFLLFWVIVAIRGIELAS